MATHFRRLFCITLAFACIMLSVCPSRWAKGGEIPSRPKACMVILCADGLTMEDVFDENLPELNKVFDQGSCAVLNTNVAGNVNNIDSAYLTIGTGVRAKAGGIVPGYMAEEYLPEGSVAEVQARRVGVAKGVLFQPEITSLARSNDNLGYKVEIGLLGTSLHMGGCEIAVLGTADTDLKERPIINAFMDSQGAVACGYVGKSLFEMDFKAPFGFWTSNRALITQMQKMKSSANVIAIQWADLYRVEKYSSFCDPHISNMMRREALKRLDLFIGLMAAEFAEPGWLFCLIAPFPSKNDPKQPIRLTPMVVWGEGIGKGMLTSSTTRRDGLVANIDIAPSIMQYNGVPSSDIVMGQPIVMVPRQDNLYFLRLLEQRAVANYLQRPIVMRLFIAYLISVLVLVLVASIFKPKILVAAVHRLILVGAVLPLNFLVMSLLPVLSLQSTVILVIFFSLIPAVITRNFVTSQRLLLNIAAVTVVVLIIDVIFKQRLVGSSLLGYCFVSGARYYGLGNEYMGVFVGAIFTILSSLMKRFATSLRVCRSLMLIVTLSGSYFLGAGWLAANAGGTLAFISGAGMIYLLLDGAPNAKKTIKGLLFGVCVLSSFVVFDWFMGNQASHIGRAVNDAIKMGPHVLVGIIKRKTTMNLRLLRYSLWSRVLIMLIICLCVVFYGPFKHLPRLKYRWPLFTVTLQGTLMAVIVALIANDSGVVAAATMLLFPVFHLILITLPYCSQKLRQNQQ